MFQYFQKGFIYKQETVQEVFSALYFSSYPPVEKKTCKQPYDPQRSRLHYRDGWHFQPQPASASLRLVTWKRILGVPVTWTGTKQSARPLASESPPPPPFARAHVRAAPRPTWGLRRRRGRRGSLSPPPPQHSVQIRVPDSIILEYPPPPFYLPASGPTTCPERLLTFSSGGLGAGEPSREASSPWPLSRPAGTGSGGRRCRKLNSGAGASRWVPASRSCHFPQHQRLLRSPPFSSSLGLPGGGGCRRAQYTACGNRSLCSAGWQGGPGRHPPPPQGGGWSSEGGPRTNPCCCLTWSYPRRKGVPVAPRLEVRFILPFWPLEKFVHPPSLALWS